MKMMLIPWLIGLLVTAGGVYSSPLPRDSVEIIVTPEDLKNAAEYAVVKIPELKDNFKTLVKQKLLNRIISKDFQQLITVVDPVTGKVSFSRQDSMANNANSQGNCGGEKSEPIAASDTPSRDIQVQLPKHAGMVTTILKGSVVGANDPFETDCTDDESEGEENEHVGYKRPYTKKTNHKDMGIKGGKLEPPDPFDQD